MLGSSQWTKGIFSQVVFFLRGQLSRTMTLSGNILYLEAIAFWWYSMGEWKLHLQTLRSSLLSRQMVLALLNDTLFSDEPGQEN